MDETKLLAQARQHVQTQIAKLYRTFERYPHDAHVAACPHCVHDEDHQRLYRAPLRELQFDDISKYAWKAMTTWGNANDGSHFLPRLVELQTWQWIAMFDAEILFGKLRYGQWRTWPADQQQAIETYFDALWRCRLLLPLDEGVSSEETLCAIAQAVDDLEPFLTVWQHTFTSNSLERLRELQEGNMSRIAKQRRLDGWWRERSAQMEQIIAWLIAPQTRAIFEQHFDAALDSPYADTLAVVIDNFQFLSFLPAA